MPCSVALARASPPVSACAGKAGTPAARFDRPPVSVALARVNPFVDDCAGSRGTFLNRPIGMTNNPMAMPLAVHVGTFLNPPGMTKNPIAMPLAVHVCTIYEDILPRIGDEPNRHAPRRSRRDLPQQPSPWYHG